MLILFYQLAHTFEVVQAPDLLNCPGVVYRLIQLLSAKRITAAGKYLVINHFKAWVAAALLTILFVIRSTRNEGKIKKNAFEIVSYSSELAKQLGTEIVVLAINVEDTSELNKYGASKIIKVSNSKLDNFDSQIFTIGGIKIHRPGNKVSRTCPF